MTVYGVDWVNGDGISKAYTNKHQAYLEIMIENLEEYFHWRKPKNNADLENFTEDLSADVRSLFDDDYIEDFCYITPIELV